MAAPRKLNPNLYRIIHIDNLHYILKIKKITCPKHYEKDSNYIGIGDKSLIEKRNNAKISLEPFGTFRDYVSFYFGARTPMLYNIMNGYCNVKKYEQSEIIYLVTSYNSIKDSRKPFVYFDGQGYHHLSVCYNDDSGLDKIDWKAVRAKYWEDTIDEPDLKRKKQAELLVYWELPLSCIKEISVYNNIALKKVCSIIQQNSVNLNCKINRDWYY